MSFFDFIKQSFDEDSLLSLPTFRATLIGDSALYLENIIAIKSYSQTQILLYLKKGEIAVLGERLFIKKYCGGDMVICGKIISIQKG